MRTPFGARHRGSAHNEKPGGIEPRDSSLEEVRKARRAIAQLHQQLLDLKPGAMSECTGLLTGAITSMEKIQAELRGGKQLPGPQLLRREMQSLRQELTCAGALLKAAGAFYEGYGRLLGRESDAETAPYNPSGKALTPIRTGGRITVHG